MNNERLIQERHRFVKALQQAVEQEEQQRRAKLKKEEKNVSENKKRPGV